MSYGRILPETVYSDKIILKRKLANTHCLILMYIFRSIKEISFNDYYKTWSTIATSKATEHYRSSCKVI